MLSNTHNAITTWPKENIQWPIYLQKHFEIFFWAKKLCETGINMNDSIGCHFIIQSYLMTYS